MSDDYTLITWLQWLDAVNARPDIKATTKSVAIALRKHAKNETGICYPGQQLLAHECGLALTQKAPKSVKAPVKLESATVGRAVRELALIGALEVESGKGHRTSRYRLIPADAWRAVGRQDGRAMTDIGRQERRPTSSAPGEVVRRDGRVRAVCIDGSGPSVQTGQGRQERRPELLKVTTERTAAVTTMEAEAEPLLPEARPKAVLGESDLRTLFADWKDRCRPRSGQLSLTTRRRVAVRSRRSRDGFTFDELREAINGAGRAVDEKELDYEHKDTEFARIFADREHVEAWISYSRDGDYGVLGELFATEESRTAAPVVDAAVIDENGNGAIESSSDVGADAARALEEFQRGCREASQRRSVRV